MENRKALMRSTSYVKGEGFNCTDPSYAEPVYIADMMALGSSLAEVHISGSRDRYWPRPLVGKVDG